MAFAIAFYGVGLPALAAALVYGACWFAAARQRSVASWAVPLALLGAYASGHVGILGWPPLPPREATHWTLWAACAMAAISLVEAAVARLAAPARWTIRAVVATAALRGALDAVIEHAWGASAGWLRLAALAAAAIAAWFVLERTLASRAAHPAISWLALTAIACGTALALALTGSLSLGQLAGALAVGLAVTVGVSLACRSPGLVPAVLPVPAWILTGLLVAGVFYSSLPWISALLLAFAPAVLLAIPSGSTRRELWRAAAILLPVAAGVIVAVLAAPSYEY